MEKIPEKFLNEDGGINTDALIKSYCALEKKIGAMVSVPADDADEQTRARFNHAIGVPDNADEYPVHALFDEDGLREKFLQIGLTKNQVEKIYNIADEFLTPVLSDLFSARQSSDAMRELEKFFGGTEKTKTALRAINAFGEKFLPRDAFEELCTTAQGIQSVYRMMQSMEPDVHTDKNVSENLSDADLRRMMRDPKYWRDADPEYVRKIENGFKKLYS